MDIINKVIYCNVYYMINVKFMDEIRAVNHRSKYEWNDYEFKLWLFFMIQAYKMLKNYFIYIYSMNIFVY